MTETSSKDLGASSFPHHEKILCSGLLLLGHLIGYLIALGYHQKEYFCVHLTLLLVKGVAKPSFPW